MATKKPIAGKRLIHLYRLVSKQATEDGKKMFFATEDSESISNDTETTVTKDGSETTPQGAEVTLSSTNLLSAGDQTIKDMKKACKLGEEVEAWVVNLDDPAEGSGFNATYYRGYVTSFETNGAAEGFAEVSIEYACRGVGADGVVTLTDDQIEEASYAFENIAKKGA